MALWVYAGVWSPHLKKWRASQPHPVGHAEMLAGGQIGNVQEPNAWLQWNLASSTDRPQRLDDAGQAIAGLALPYLARFQDVPGLLQALASTDIPERSVGAAIELCVSFNDCPGATAIAARALASRPQLVVFYDECLAQLVSRGYPRTPPNGYAEELAWACFAQGLNINA